MTKKKTVIHSKAYPKILLILEKEVKPYFSDVIPADAKVEILGLERAAEKIDLLIERILAANNDAWSDSARDIERRVREDISKKLRILVGLETDE